MPKKRKTKRKKPKSRKKKVVKNKTVERWLFAIAAILVIALIVVSVPAGELGSIMQGEQTQTTTVSYACDRNLECFLVNCKNTPNVVECVNVLGMETYYKKCDPAKDWNVNPYIDSTKCACVQNLCKLIK